VPSIRSGAVLANRSEKDPCIKGARKIPLSPLN